MISLRKNPRINHRCRSWKRGGDVFVPVLTQ
jgi:hypothetical protein